MTTGVSVSESLGFVPEEVTSVVLSNATEDGFVFGIQTKLKFFSTRDVYRYLAQTQVV